MHLAGKIRNTLSMEKLRIAAYTLDLPEYACAQLRVLQPALHLADTVNLDWCTQSKGDDYVISDTCLERADLVLLQRSFPQKETWPLIVSALASGKPVLYDLDDNFFAMPAGHPMTESVADNCLPFITKLIKRLKLVSVSTPALRDAIQPLTGARIEVLPNFLPDRLWKPVPPPMPSDGPLCIGYAGSFTHGRDLALAEEALIHTAERFGDRVRILLFGCGTPELKRLPQTRMLPFDYSYAAFADTLPALGLHIGLAPLQDAPFNHCKSDIKWQEYAASGICGIYSDCAPYSARVRSGENGLLAGESPQDWEQALAFLLETPAACRRIALAAQEELLSSCLLSQKLGQYLSVWLRAARR